MTAQNFSSLPLLPDLIQVTQELGYATMTPIQVESLPHLLEGKDLIGQSKTGSGKTAAFSLPILNKIQVEQNRYGVLQAMILCPTRELSAQVVREIRKLGRKFEGLQVLPLTGGVPGRDQAFALDRGVHIVVGTPGRILDHIRRERMDLSQIQTLVLDEADKMLEMGFEDEISAIISELPRDRQTVLFSATFPEGIELLSQRYQKNPVKVKVEDSAETSDLIRQLVYELGTEDKKNILMRVLQQHEADSILIFCNTKAAVTNLVELLQDQGVACGGLQGDMDQRQRDLSMAMFRNGSYKILVATDVASRGIDIGQLELVINYDFPLQPEDYIHRIGRTGRAGRSGTAVIFVGPSEKFKIFEVEKQAKATFERPNLGFKNQHGLPPGYGQAKMQTLVIVAGRKDKLRAGDILGAFTGDGGLQSSEVGKIEIHDTFTYVAVSSMLSKEQIARLCEGKIKGKKYQVRVLK